MSIAVPSPMDRERHDAGRCPLDGEVDRTAADTAQEHRQPATSPSRDASSQRERAGVVGEHPAPGRTSPAPPARPPAPGRATARPRASPRSPRTCPRSTRTASGGDRGSSGLAESGRRRAPGARGRGSGGGRRGSTCRPRATCRDSAGTRRTTGRAPSGRTWRRAASSGGPRCGPRGCRCDPRRSSRRSPARRRARRAWRTCQPIVVAHAVAEGVRQRAEPAARLRQEVEQADLVEHPFVPVGRRADDAGESPDPVGEAAGTGVDESRRERSPTWRTARAPGRRGRSASDRRASGRVRRARRTSAPRGRRARRGPVDRVAAARRVRRRDRPAPAIVAAAVAGAGRHGAGAGGRPPMARIVDRRRRRLEPRRDVGAARPRRRRARRSTAATARGRACTARCRLGHVQRNADVGRDRPRVVRLGAAAAERAPHRVVRPRRARASGPVVAIGRAAVIDRR